MQKKVLFICLHRPDRSPSQRFRFEQYIDYLRENNFDCSHVFLLNQRDDKAFYAAGKPFQKAWILFKSLTILIQQTFVKKYDIIYVQREAFMLGTAFFEKMMAKRSQLIFDFDDTIWQHQAGEKKSKNKFLYFLKKPAKTKKIIRYADVVFAGNQFLADFASHYNNNVMIVPTTIDTKEYKPTQQEKKELICIGWSGSFSTIIHFEHILNALRTLKDKYQDRIIFKVIGDENFEDKELNTKGIPWSKETELEELNTIDIGIMPLPDNEWTKGKCGLKALQYMALGIPSIMSPVGVNQEIITEGKTGLFASSNEEWVEKLSLLIDSKELRETIGKAGREVIEKNYSVVANRDYYLDTFRELTQDKR